MSQEYLYTEEVQIPSKGLFNPDLEDGKVTLRCIELRDQKYLAGSKKLAADKPFELIQRCIVEPESFNIKKLTSRDIFYLLVKLRALSYGPNYSYFATCPVCSKMTKIETDLSKLMVNQLENYDPKTLEVVLPHRGDTVVTKVQTQEDLDEVEREAERVRDRAQGNLDYDPTIVLNLVSQIQEIKLKEPNHLGVTVLDNPIDIEAYVEHLTDYDAIAISSTADKLDYGIQPFVEDVCNNCGSDIRVLFRTGTAEFLHPRYNPDA